jgi:hypothetical protein
MMKVVDREEARKSPQPHREPAPQAPQPAAA